MDNKKKGYVKRVNFMCTLSALLALILFLGFLHKRTLFRFEYPLDTEAVGQYGDFIGGVVGTIISAVLLYFTFKLQREESESNALVYKKEQLNDTFYRLIDQYQKIIDTISYNDDDSFFTGKEALHRKYADLQMGFVNTDNDSRNRKNAIAAYQEFYSFNRDYVPTLYRIMYRICDVINSAASGLDGHRVKLMKVFRAQMNDIELCLLRYNAMSLQGKKFVPFINKYNLIKHLPPIELLEYSYWRNKMTLEEQNSTNILLESARHNLMVVLEKGSLLESFTNNSYLYNINITTNQSRTEVNVCLYIRPAVEPSKYDLIHGIYKLNHNDRHSLLKQFLRDSILISTFMLNKPQELDWKSSMIEPDGKYYASVTNKKNNPLRLRTN